ncbi:CoA ester lyase [Actinomadura sp. BRA 177]|uniref:HpcH/HpaI aldolase/citrate lyase family protein n=1 Tax=Actinomadura sp. BRA 177 TaxID=2745202 RepID=UPI001596095D|nr:CoA ester lyase [Actinomadura sp. BRA 177]NVI92764.1 CoA ester lyase [Actinomadura sp. BRA 177]
MIARTYMYVPGNAPDKLAKAPARGADALIVDLEDAVPQAAKEAARADVADWLAGMGASGAGPDIWVRVNPGEAGLIDARVVTGPAVTGLCLAKAESAAGLAALDRVVTEAETAAGLAPRTLRVMPLLESAAALLAAPEIARAPRVARLQLGEADLAADLGVVPGPDGRELLWARSTVVAASAAARISPPIAPVSVDVRDLDLLRETTRALSRMGFLGRACVHPAQIPVINEVFTPTPETVAEARGVLERYDRSLAEGSAVCLDDQGRLVDEAVVRSARRVVELAR